MLPFYFIMIGMYLYYSKSKYFPNSLFQPGFNNIRLAGLLSTAAGTAFYLRSDGLAGGFLLALAACGLAMGLIQLFAVLGKSYFYGLVAVVHILLLIELISYAS